MGYEQTTSSKKRLTGAGLAVLFHVLLVYGLASGLATDLVQKVQRTVNVAIIPEAKPPPPPPPPPPEEVPADEPEAKTVERKVVKPKAYVPKVEVAIKPSEAPAENAIASVTTSTPTAVVRTPRRPKPKAISRARLRPGCKPPSYPKRSLDKGEEGSLEFRFLIGEDGRIKDSKLVKSSGFGRLDEAARKAFERCQFVPVTVAGVTRPTWVRQPFEWRLR
jgi:protein TonB